MASYISVPRDLSKVKTKVFMNLTKRQILCFGAGALIGVPVFFLLKSSGNLSLAALGMMAVMLPLFFLAMYEKDGQPLEVVAKHFYEAKFKRPKTRPYKTKNYYALLVQQMCIRDRSVTVPGLFASLVTVGESGKTLFELVIF